MEALDILGDPVRRKILELLSQGECSSGEVVEVIQKLTGQNLWDPSVRFLSTLPARADPIEIVGIAALALILSFLATLYPSYKAASTDPVQVLRYE